MLLIIISTMIYFSVNSFALTEGDREFQLLDAEVEITGYLGEGGDVVIPDTIYGCPVTSVCCNNAGKDFINATSIKFPNTIKTINCVNL